MPARTQSQDDRQTYIPLELVKLIPILILYAASRFRG
jgi:hypothetical protein